MTERRNLASSDPSPIPLSARALYCTDAGVFVWPGVPLVRKRVLPGGGIHFTKCDPQTAWERLLPWHGEEVNGSALAATLTSACAYLNSGDTDEARKWVDRLPLPPLRPETLAKINNAWPMQPRVPAGVHGGGQFGSGGFQEAAAPRNTAQHKRFFDELHKPLTELAASLGLPENYLLGLAAYESGYYDDHNMALRNPLGLTRGGRSNLQFQSVESAISYWKTLYAEQVRGATSPQDFAARLEGVLHGKRIAGWNKYNDRNKKWEEELIGVINSIGRRRQSWSNGK